jgi:Big-like domain-containing protein
MSKSARRSSRTKRSPGRIARLLLSTVSLAAMLAMMPAAADASLTILKQNPGDPATFTGNGGYSADGLGQNGSGDSLQAEVPPGSTVEQAYLYGTYLTANPDATQRTIDFDGTAVVLTKISDVGNLSTARAAVTSQVRVKVGSGGGITNYQVNNDPSGLDGVALVVIFSNPALPDTTIAVLNGSASQTGDSASFNFAEPLDKTVPGFSATMTLGSGFSFQGAPGHVCGPFQQFSIVEVNNQLLTNCAGGYDDGQGNDGALITVGGVGDSTDNPTPPANPPTDDELYNLEPFLQQGDTGVTIDSSNPSENDNLFLAVIAITARAVVTSENCTNGVDDDDDGLVDGQDPDCQQPATLALEPQSGSNEVGSQHCVTATVRNLAGEPASGVTVRFSVSGANTASGQGTTNANGRTRFCYTGQNPGQDQIRAFADTDRDGTRDAGEPQGTATKTWTPAQVALDHFLYYPIEEGSPAFQPRTVTVRDQFRTSQTRVVAPLRLLNPADKNGEGINRRDAHLKCYKIQESRFGGRTVTVQNQFGTRSYQVRQPTRLCNPASKRVPPGPPGPVPSGLSHFRCYGIEGGPLNRAVTVRDQFGRQQVVVGEPEYLCNPASKNGSPISNPTAHLVCYELEGVDPFAERRVSLRDQFGVQSFQVEDPTKLCVPSRKRV